MTKLTPIQASLRKKEGYVYNNFLERKKIKPKFPVNNLVRTADLKKTFSKTDTNIWSYKLHKITQIMSDTKATYHFHSLPKRYNKALLKKSELTLKENKDVMKKLNIA